MKKKNMVKKSSERAANLNLWSWLIALFGLVAAFENNLIGIGFAILSVVLSLLARSDDKTTSPAALIFGVAIIVFAIFA